MKKASKSAPKALGKKAPTAKKSPTKPKSREAQGQTELVPIVERLAQSAERLAQAAVRLAQQAALQTQRTPERLDEHLGKQMETAAENDNK